MICLNFISDALTQAFRVQSLDCGFGPGSLAFDIGKAAGFELNQANLKQRSKAKAPRPKPQSED
jgi:hypothetical protein